MSYGEAKTMNLKTSADVYCLVKREALLKEGLSSRREHIAITPEQQKIYIFTLMVLPFSISILSCYVTQE